MKPFDPYAPPAGASPNASAYSSFARGVGERRPIGQPFVGGPTGAPNMGQGGGMQVAAPVQQPQPYGAFSGLAGDTGQGSMIGLAQQATLQDEQRRKIGSTGVANAVTP